MSQMPGMNVAARDNTDVRDRGTGTADCRGDTHSPGALRDIWRRVLNIDTLGDDDDFFDLGGTSLQAMEILVAIKRVFGVRLPLSTFIECPTIAHMRARLTGSVEQVDSPLLIRFQAGDGTLPPLFLVHGLLGHIFLAPELLAELDPRLTVYGIQAQGLASDDPPSKSVAAAATAYVEAVRQATGGGPFHLGGFCHGSLIALEMATRLGAAEGRISPPILIDPPAQPRGHVYRHMRLGRLRLALRKRIDRGITPSNLQLRLDRFRERTTRWHPRINDPQLLSRVVRVSGNMWRLLRYHVPCEWQGSVVLLTSRIRREKMLNPGSYWQSYGDDQLTVRIVAESHSSIFSDASDRLGAILNETMKESMRGKTPMMSGSEYQASVTTSSA